jgi:hypothetical protein
MMTNLKITTLNGEWMNNWFEKVGGGAVKFKPTFQELGSTTVMDTDRADNKALKANQGNRI